MADNIPSLPGGVPPKPPESKVQPKKETVRINLPPKPSAAPTIKLPTLPPGGPSATPGAPTFAPPPPGAAPHTPAPRPATAAPVSAVPQPRAQQRPAPVPVAAVSGLDKGLAIGAAVAAAAAVGTTVWMMMLLQQALEK